MCKAEFRLYKNDVYNLIEVFHLPDQFTCYNGLKLDSLEGFCMLLKRYAYPCRYLDMITRFARPVPQLCMASNLIMDSIYTAWSRLLTNLNQPWLSPVNLERFAIAVLKKVHLYRIALALLMVQSGQLADLAQINDYCTMDIKRSMQSNFNLWLFQVV